MKRLIAFFFALFILFPNFAHALTGAEFREKLSSDERVAYYNGSVETAYLIYARSGQKEKAQCIFDWYAKDPEKSHAELKESFIKYKDQHSHRIMYVLFETHCGSIKKKMQNGQ